MSSQEREKPFDAFDQVQADLYRTRWLAAHNRLHDLVEGDQRDPQEVWHAYLNELIEVEKTVRKVA